jgi:hypothetical protein
LTPIFTALSEGVTKKELTMLIHDKHEFLESANWLQLQVELREVEKLVGKFTCVYTGKNAAKYDGFDAPHRAKYRSERNYIAALIDRRFPADVADIAAVLECVA